MFHQKERKKKLPTFLSLSLSLFSISLGMFHVICSLFLSISCFIPSQFYYIIITISCLPLSLYGIVPWKKFFVLFIMFFTHSQLFSLIFIIYFHYYHHQHWRLISFCIVQNFFYFLVSTFTSFMMLLKLLSTQKLFLLCHRFRFRILSLMCF